MHKAKLVSNLRCMDSKIDTYFKNEPNFRLTIRVNAAKLSFSILTLFLQLASRKLDVDHVQLRNSSRFLPKKIKSAYTQTRLQKIGAADILSPETDFYDFRNRL